MTDDDPFADARREGRALLAASPRAAIYTRMSLASMDDQTKVDDQERRCREMCERLGWEVADANVYTDNNRSAWRHDRKRPGWDAMLNDVEAGRVDAIAVYHGDRLVRQPMDLEVLLQLARGKGVRLASPAGTRNLDSAEDQFVLSIEAAMARRESANISRRQKARYERDRRAGKVMAQGPGGRRFGYRSDGVTLFPADRCELELRREVTEAEVIREAAARVLAGESANRIEADLRRRGWTTPAGKRIQHGTLKRWLVNPRYAGLMPDGEAKAAWPAILDDRETYERVRLLLAERAAAYPRDSGNGVRWLLSGIAVCGRRECGRPLMIAHVTSRGYKSAVYACDSRSDGCGKVWRNAVHLDAYVAGRVVARMANPLNPGARARARRG
jgi:DNA invertase Pin-like site-specific DNA recombinase